MAKRPFHSFPLDRARRFWGAAAWKTLIQKEASIPNDPQGGMTFLASLLLQKLDNFSKGPRDHN